MLPQNLLPCRNHAGAPAMWQCESCHIHFCDQCITPHNFGQIRISICPLCRGKCASLQEAPPPHTAPAPVTRVSPVMVLAGVVVILCLGLLVARSGFNIFGVGAGRGVSSGDGLFLVHQLTPSDAHGAEVHPCLLSTRCLVVYLAPWCPYCKRSVPIVQKLQERWEGDEIGIVAVIGADSSENIQAMAKTVGEGSYVDLDQSFGKQMGVKGVPAWFLMNDRGEVLTSFSGAPADVSGLLAKLDL
jgi:thiol-disulfide isomerase/thioredoxin